MPPCDFRIVGPDSLKRGEKATYQVQPSLLFPCRTRILINGKEGQPHTEVNGIRVTQVSLGVVSVEALIENPITRITITVIVQRQCLLEVPTTESFNIGEDTQKSPGQMFLSKLLRRSRCHLQNRRVLSFAYCLEESTSFLMVRKTPRSPAYV